MRIKLPQTHKVLSVFSYSSLTDIVLLLLIFFLLTSSFIATKGLAVRLPEAKNAKTVELGTVTVSLLADGRVLVNDAPCSMDALPVEMKKLITDPTKQTVVLSADKEVPFQRAVRVMDDARGLGVARFFITTLEKDTGDAPGL